MGGRDQCGLLRLARCDKAPVVGAEHRVATHAAHGGEVQRGVRRRLAAPDRAFPAQRARVAQEWGESRERGDGSPADLSQLGQLSHQCLSGDRADAGHRLLACRGDGALPIRRMVCAIRAPSRAIRPQASGCGTARRRA